MVSDNNRSVFDEVSFLYNEAKDKKVARFVDVFETNFKDTILMSARLGGGMCRCHLDDNVTTGLLCTPYPPSNKRFGRLPIDEVEEFTSYVRSLGFDVTVTDASHQYRNLKIFEISWSKCRNVKR